LEDTGELEWGLADTKASGAAPLRRPSDETPDEQRRKASIKGRLFGGDSGEKVRIGRFVVLKRIGEGGMGVVYAAFDPELDRKIAIKLLHPETAVDDSPDQGAARLVREAQALARVSHPNVVQIYEIGTHGEQVFVAMEFVEGETLADWLAAHPERTWREVLEKFIPAGRGLAAAHAKKLIHRDFKPANVLVADNGQVRVLDFGLARRVRAGSTSASSTSSSPHPRSSASNLNLTITRAGVRVGTPAYMAPEQHMGASLDARTDQFSFCVALYEGLYRERPFGGSTLTQLSDNVTEGKLRRPPKDAKVPDWLRRIVVRGLKPDTDDRWASMEVLLEELGHDPNARRRRLFAVAGAAMILAGGTTFGYYAREEGRAACAGAENQLAGVWDKGRKEVVRKALMKTGAPIAGETWNRVSALVDAYTTQWVAQRVATCETHQRGEQSDHMLDLRMRCLDERLDAVRAHVEVLSNADETVVAGAITAAAQLPTLAACEDTEALMAQLKPPDDPQVARDVERIRETLAQSDALGETGKFQDAHAMAAGAVAEAQHIDYPPVLAEALLRRGQRELDLEQYEEAQASLGEAFWASVEAEHDEVAAAAASGRMIALVEQDEFKESLEWAQHAKSVVKKIGEDTEAAARLRESLGRVLEEQAKNEEARAEYERAIEIIQKLRGEGHVRTANISHRMGVIAYRQLNFDESRRLFQSAIDLRDEALGPGHPNNINSLVGIGATYRAQSNLDKAREYPKRAIELSEKAFGPEHLSAARAYNNLGIVNRQDGKLEDAKENYEKALRIYEKHRGSEHRDVALALSNLGNVYERSGDYDKTLEVATRALDIRKKVLGSSHPDTATSFDNVGEAHLRLGNYEQALVHFDQAMSIRQRTLDPDHPTVGFSLMRTAQAQIALGRVSEAIPNFERALEIHAKHDRKKHLAETQFDLAKTLWERKPERSRALELARKARDGYVGLGTQFSTEQSQVEAWLKANSSKSG
jgi:tetratricopeptide (TPR) repeat protein/predicted Ser/Thr protein kinase